MIEFANLTNANCPPSGNDVEVAWRLPNGTDTINETKGIVLQKYLALYGEDCPLGPLRFRVKP